MRVLVLLSVLCAIGVVASEDQDRDHTLECFKPESFVKCATTKLPSKQPCAAGVTPTFDFAQCCLSCRPVPAQNVTCPNVAFTPCDLRQLTIGTINNALLDSNLCPKCNLRQSVKDRSKLDPEESCELLKLPKCRASESPSIVNGCPTCRPVEVCERPAAACNVSVCDTGVYPALDPATCCPTCKLSSAAINAAVACATHDKISSCASSLHSKPPCAASAAPVYSTGTCCVDCVPQLPEREDENHKCKDNEVRQCLLKVPSCADDQVQVANNKSCCKLCKRPEWKCSPSEVAACLVNAPVCAAGEIPQRVDGACCRSCKRAPPTCSPTCGAGYLCVPNGESGTAHCKAATVLNLKLTVNATLVTTLGGFSDSSLKEYLLEVFARYCEVPENQAQCDAVGDDIKALVIKEKTFGTVEIHLVLVLTGAGSVSTSAHALRTFAATTASGSATALQAALSSSVAQDGDSAAASATVDLASNAAMLAASPHLSWLFATLMLAALLALF